MIYIEKGNFCVNFSLITQKWIQWKNNYSRSMGDSRPKRSSNKPAKPSRHAQIQVFCCQVWSFLHDSQIYRSWMQLATTCKQIVNGEESYFQIKTMNAEYICLKSSSSWTSSSIREIYWRPSSIQNEWSICNSCQGH